MRTKEYGAIPGRQLCRAIRGRYLWEYRFVRGLPGGYKLGGWRSDEVQEHEYGSILEIEVDAHDLSKCTVTVENETCSSCEP